MNTIANEGNELTEWLTREQYWKAIYKQLEKTQDSLDTMFRLFMAGAGELPTAEMKKYYLILIDQELEARSTMNNFMFSRMN